MEGVGDVCSLAAFDFARHGNAKYGAPAEAPKVRGGARVLLLGWAVASYWCLLRLRPLQPGRARL